MSTVAHCTECGATLPTGILGNRCPRCLVQLALDTSAEQAAPAEVPAPTEIPLVRGHSFGDYELLEVIARGGMGIVYKARQKSLNRIVAVKLMLSSGQSAQPEVVQRFRTEAQAVAHLQHPNIVAIHEIGEHDGQHYFSMEYVEGRTLAEMVRDGPLAATRAATYLKTISEAVQYAHTHDLLHRDLKPSNVLIDSSDQPRITDFGLAKRLEGSQLSTFNPQLTLSGQVLGSPNYLSPEQAAGRPAEVGPVSDVYALGAMLYHLLTGRPPFQGDSLTALLRQVMETDPVGPRLLNPGIPRDLETICLKCLEKDRLRRYETAQVLADELGRFLRGEPIHARPVSRPGKVWRWCQRRPVRASLIGALVTVFALGLVGVLWQWRRADVAQGVAFQMLRQSQIQRAEDLFASEDAAPALGYLALVLREDPSNPVAAERLLSALTYRSFALQAVPPLIHIGGVHVTRFSPDGQKLLTASSPSSGSGARVWDARTGRPITDTLRHNFGVTFAQFSPDGQRVVTASADHTARIWNAVTGQPLIGPLRHRAAVEYAQFSPDGQQVVTASQDGTARVWNAETGEPAAGPLKHDQSVQYAQFSPDGHRVVTASIDNTARIWAVRTGELLIEILRLEGPDVYTPSGIVSAQFSADGSWLLTTSCGKTARVWDAHNGRPLSPPLKHDDGVCSAQFSPDGQRVVTASEDKTARIWDARTGQLLCGPLKHDRPVWPAQFSPDGLRLATAAWDSTVRVWDACTGQPLMEPFKHDGAAKSAQFSPDGWHVATASEDKTARILEVTTGNPLTDPLKHGDRLNSAQFSPDGKRVITASRDKTARIWDARTSQLQMALRHNDEVLFAEFSPDGSRVLTASRDRTARVWDAVTGDPLTPALEHNNLVAFAHFSRDGAWVLTASKDGTARVWDARSGEPRTRPLPHEDRVNAAEFSPDGQRVITASTDWTAAIWNARTGHKLLTLEHRDRVLFGEFSPDGKKVVTASADYAGHVWDSRNGQPLAPPFKHRARVTSARFSPDGRRVVTASWDRAARVWDVRTGQLLAEFSHKDEVWSAEFSGDGGRVVTASSDKTARVWDVRTGLPLTEPLKHNDQVVWAKFSPDGQRAVTASYDSSARVWDVPIAPLPIPGWLPQLAEVISGERLTARGMRESVTYEEYAGLKKQLTESPATDFYARWAKWFFADRATRTISPLSPITLSEYVQHRLEEDTMTSLLQAVRLSPNNALASARLARRLAKQDPKDNPRQMGEAAFFSRRAVELAPNDAEVLQIKGEVAERLSNLEKP